MDICIYYDYRVCHICDYSYFNEDGEITCETIKENFIINGRKLIEIIGKDLLHNEFSSISSKDNEIIIEMFDPHSGLTEDHRFVIVEIKEQGNE
jgi:hypothetical protein